MLMLLMLHKGSTVLGAYCGTILLYTVAIFTFFFHKLATTADKTQIPCDTNGLLAHKLVRG